MNREQFLGKVEGTQEALRRFLVALCCGDTFMADDIAQETFIKAWLSSDTLADASRFRSWIFRIAYTTFLNHKRSERIFSGYEDAGMVAAADSADSSFRYQALYAALDLLPARERTSLLLFYLEGYSVREISGIVGASQDAVKQYLSRGRSHLRGMLDK